MKRLLFLFVVLVVVAAVGNFAQAATLEIVGVRAGFEGHYKVGCWTPVEVLIHGGDEPLAGQLELVVPDGDGVPSRVSTGRERVALTPGQDVSVMMFVKFGQIADDLKADLRIQGSLVAERLFDQGSNGLDAAMSADQELIVMAGAPIAINEQTGQTNDGSKRTIVARLDDVGQLPTRWYGYEGVDLLILTTSRAELYRNLAGARLEALDQWVRLGGRMVLGVGRMANEILAPDAPLARFAPGKFERLVPLRQTGSLESYAETPERLDQQLDGERGNFRLEVPKLSDVRGRIEVYDGNNPRDLPLVVRAPHGLGEVVFVALDLDQQPFSTWKGQKQLLDKLLARPKVTVKEAGSSDTLGQVSSLGYSDMVGQLHSALDQFAEVQLVPFWAVAALVILYILLIGPIDYFFLKKIVGRMEFTWITFPLVVLIFSVGAYLLAYRLKGTELRQNQVDLVDVDVETQLVRGTTWTTIYSPQIDSFDWALEPHPAKLTSDAEPAVVLSWMAVPGTGLTGMRGSSGASLFSKPYDFTPQLDQIKQMPIPIWSTRSLVGRWTTQAASPVTGELTDRGDRLLAGKLEVAPELAFADGALIYERWAYPIHQWPSDGTIQVEKDLEPQTIETYFRHAQAFEENGNQRYDASSTKLPRILESMMFHDLIGGQAYTNLTHRSHGYVDLSNQVRMGQAVLVGRAKSPASTMMRDGEPLTAQLNQHLTIYRFVLPVKKSTDTEK